MSIIDKTVLCPYDKHHQISTSRLQRHLIKCEKNYPMDYLSICPFNATHRMPKVEMEKHITNCPQKVLQDIAKYQHKVKNILLPVNMPKVVDDDEYLEDEDWENNIDSDIEINLTNENISYEQAYLDERIPDWVQQTTKYKNTELIHSFEKDIANENEIPGNLNEISFQGDNITIAEKLKKIHFQKKH